MPRWLHFLPQNQNTEVIVAGILDAPATASQYEYEHKYENGGMNRVDLMVQHPASREIYLCSTVAKILWLFDR
jgi:hypothetical protein